ncbi:MAG TPA: type II secretion system protein [Desulfomonilia bacterium]|nr:type II secretion system protein [Desulfomonilia bacterium]
MDRNSQITDKLNPSPLSSRRGFTLIEMAFVLVIVGILVSLGAQLLPMLVKQNKLKDDRALVEQAKNALIGYALATGRLPFASTNVNGSEIANRLNGYLPWSTIGVTGMDAYQKTLFYCVDSHLTAAGSVTKAVIGPLIATPPPANQNLYSCLGAVRVAFVVISSGENRRVDSPNDKNNNGIIDPADLNTFACPYASITSNYDDILQDESLSDLNFRAP